MITDEMLQKAARPLRIINETCFSGKNGNCFQQKKVV